MHACGTPEYGTAHAVAKGAMSVEALRDVTRVMDSLSPEQNEMLDLWSEQLQAALRSLVDQGGRDFDNEVLVGEVILEIC